jgi:lantibiotic leader peptide-processing serine protease
VFKNIFERSNMLMRSDALRMCGVLSILIVAAACGDEVTTKPAVRQFAPSLSRDATPISGRHVFALNGNVPADFASRVAAAGGTVVRMIPSINVVVTDGLTDAGAAKLASSNEVAQDVEAQWIPSADSLQLSTSALTAPADATSILPPQAAFFLPLQWNMFQIHAPEAWANHTGIPSVRVAILDTGLDPDHLDAMGLIDQASSVAFVPSTNGPPTWADDNFHGTHVGGIVTSNNFGTAGVAPNVTLIAVKVLNAAGTGNFGNIIAGIVWATDVHAQVINMSVGMTFPKQAPGLALLVAALNRAINYAKSHGVLVVSAAGNEAVDLQHAHEFISLPCEAGVQLCVSATGPGDVPASYTNYGTNAINVAAPGGEVAPAPASFVLSLCSSHSVLPAFAACKSRTRYIYVAGTSQAAPHVSGLAALLDSQFGGQLNPSQMITLIQQNADDLGKPGADPFFGKGRINVFTTVNSTTP